MDKVYAFIDYQNLNVGTKTEGYEIDFQRFRSYLKTKYNVTKAFIFIGFIDKNSKLYTYLQECGFVLVFKPVLAIRTKGKITYKGNVDAELVLHAMIEIVNYSQAVIVSGDGDFYCLIEHLDSNGKLLKILTPNHHYSSLIRKFSAKILQLGIIRKKIEKLQ